ncbi:MAG: arginine decarboxylase, pyruvoyl-dependent [Firmicutes bacterium]|nr:arginine decarboxylase, pyruvoyl-dependent [Bacillota bacterium]
MLITPTTFSLTAGRAEGGTPLTAFDAALLDAGLGNLNLLKVSSIVPPGARLVETPAVPPGSLVPVAYGTITSQDPGQVISAGVAVGLTGHTFGMIMEYSGRRPKEEVEALLERMVHESLERRGLKATEYYVRAVEHTVARCGSVFAAVLLWYD